MRALLKQTLVSTPMLEQAAAELGASFLGFCGYRAEDIHESKRSHVLEIAN